VLKEERQHKILELLHVKGHIIASELPEHLDVSMDTIRRDLDELARANKLQRTHGGALPRSTVPDTYEGRQHQSLSGKIAVAEAAISLLKPKQVILLDGGTTALEIANRLPLDYEGTIVTHSPVTTVALSKHPHVEVLLVGGKFDRRAMVAVGSKVVEYYRSIRADICFIGVTSLHAEMGIGTLYYEEAIVRKAMIESSNQVVALASSEKLGTVAPFTIGPISELSYIATENSVPESVLSPFQQQGIMIVQA